MIDTFEGEYRWLSNFYPDNGDTLEHHYQAAKTDDAQWKAAILAAPTPGKAKRLGRQCPIRETWDDEKLYVMRELVEAKFRNDFRLSILLLETGEDELVEGNWWGDTFWGVCNGVGQNHLGRILMDVREVLLTT